MFWYGNLTTLKKWLREFEKITKEDSTGTLNIFLINVEAFATIKACKFVEEFLVTHDAMMVIDESTTIKKSKGQTNQTFN